jgi:hypothetical protein
MNGSITSDDVKQYAPDYYVDVRGPMYWVNAEHTQLHCEVNFKHVGFEEWTPFTADPNDHMPYSKMIFDECVAGKFGVVGEYVPPVTINLVPQENDANTKTVQPLAIGTQTL